MAQLFNYTGGRLGTHAVTLCKPVGGGVIDIENVPIDIANDWITQKGYYQCGTTGDVSPTGYCVTTPSGNDCDTPPQPSPPSQSVIQHQTATMPHSLPSVGSGGLEIVFALVVAVIAFVIAERVQRRG